MKDQLKARIAPLLTNDWIVTLSATLIGVFVALYLNEWVAANKLSMQKSIATENIVAEMQANDTNLKQAVEKHAELREILDFISTHSDDAEGLVAESEDLYRFRKRYAEFITITDSTSLKAGNFRYLGEIHLDVNFPHLNLTSVAWRTLKNSGISSTYGFECLMYLERIDKIKMEIIQKNEELLAFIVGAEDGGERNVKLLRHLKLLIDFEKSLINSYANYKNGLSNCH